MKKEYVEPAVSVLEISCSSMLCASDPETTEVDVRNETYSGTPL